jgi:hypothetical protein
VYARRSSISWKDEAASRRRMPVPSANFRISSSGWSVAATTVLAGLFGAIRGTRASLCPVLEALPPLSLIESQGRSAEAFDLVFAIDAVSLRAPLLVVAARPAKTPGRGRRSHISQPNYIQPRSWVSSTVHAREDRYRPSASSSGARSAARCDQGLRSCRADKTVALPAKMHQICLHGRIRVRRRALARRE